MDSLTTTTSEDELFLLMQQGSEPAFAILYQRYLALLFNKAYYNLQDADEAKDVVQEVLISFWNSRAKVKITVSVKAYLMGAVQQRCADLIRKKTNRRNRQEVYASLTATITGTSPLETKELGNRLQAAMSLVTPTSRKVFVMSYIDRKPLKEVAATLNMKVQTAKNHVQQALKVLRQHLPKN